MKAKFFILGLLLCVGHVHAQSIEKANAEIIKYLDGIDKWAATDGDIKEDSLIATNKNFLHYFKKIGTNNTEVLKANFKLSKNSNLSINTSGDSNLRIFSWDTKQGGSMVAYDAIAQYYDGANTKVKVLNDASIRDKVHGRFDYGCYYDTIYTIKRKNATAIYLVISGATLGIPEVPKTIRAYTIENGQLVDTAKVFITPKKSYNKIDIDCNVESATDESIIHLSSDKTKLYIPMIDKLTFKGKFLVYVFDGENFVYDKDAK